MVGSRLGQVRFGYGSTCDVNHTNTGYVTFLCDRYGSTCDANHTNTITCRW